MCVCYLVPQSCPALSHPMDCKSTRLPCPWGFSRQEYWSQLPSSPPGDLPDPEMELVSATAPALQANFYHQAKIYVLHKNHTLVMKIHNHGKIKMENPIRIFSYQLIIGKKPFIFFCLHLLFDSFSFLFFFFFLVLFYF